MLKTYQFKTNCHTTVGLSVL